MAKVNGKNVARVKEAGAEKLNEVLDAVADSKEKVRAPGKWVKMTEEDVIAAQANGTLKGYDPKNGEGLLK